MCKCCKGSPNFPDHVYGNSCYFFVSSSIIELIAIAKSAKARSLFLKDLLSLNSSSLTDSEGSQLNIDWTSHPQWNHRIGWKHVLNNVRLLIKPSLLLWLIFPALLD